MKYKLLGTPCALFAFAAQAAEKPNILIIFPDDVGRQNVSAYGHCGMGYRTPNIDPIVWFLSQLWGTTYGRQRCAAG